MKILLAEDEERLAGLVVKAMSEEGHVVETCTSGEEVLSWLDVATFDAVILDIMLEGMDGVEACRTMRARKNSTPVLLLTARRSVDDRVAGLDAGADDYLTKPFDLAELSARLRAITRRPKQVVNPVLQIGNIQLNPASREVWVDDRKIDLPNKQFRILELLMRHPDIVVTRDMMINHVWDYEFSSETNVIDVHIRQLRKRLDQDDGPSVIETIRGTGYRLSPRR